MNPDTPTSGITVHRAVSLPIHIRAGSDGRPDYEIAADTGALRVLTACWRTLHPDETGADVDCPTCAVTPVPEVVEQRLTPAHARMLSALVVDSSLYPGHGVHANRIRRLLQGEGLLDAAGRPTSAGRDALAVLAARSATPSPSAVLNRARATTEAQRPTTRRPTGRRGPTITPAPEERS